MIEREKIKVIVLSNGLNLLGEILESHEEDTNKTAFYIKRPVMLEQAILAENRNTVKFAPFLPFTKDFEVGIPLFFKEVLSICTPLDALLDKYQEVNSQLVMPSGLIKP
jgi:hypothetical protein